MSSITLATLTTDEMERIHQAALAILAEPGMKIMEPRLLKALDAAGAKVDHDTQQVSFPAELVEETLAAMQSDLAAGVTMPVINGVIASRTDGRIAA